MSCINRPALFQTQLSSSQHLKSPAEFRAWLFAYVRKLTSEAKEHKLHEVCAWLQGPPQDRCAHTRPTR